ncbi:MAG: hypothetical protein D6744_07080 [Planctomycetota bacterium]|nr:MAG: hypothetical protein D6744_07080 [Planctomycetota bacterium]
MPDASPSHPLDSRARRTLRTTVALVVLALLARCAYLLVFQPDVADWPDGRHNEQIGWRLASEGRYDDPADNPPAIYRPPLLPLTIAAVYELFGREPRAVQFTLALFGALGVGLLHRAALRLMSSRAALIAGAAAAAYPYFVFVCGTFYPEALGVPLMALVALLFLANCQSERMRVGSMLSLGLAVGLGALCRPNWLVSLWLLVPLVYVTRWLAGRPRAIVPMAAALLVWVGVWSPWTVRNWRAYGKPILITASGGKNLYLGNKPDATWSSKTGVKITAEDLVAEARWHNDPPRLEKYYYTRALEHIRRDPARVAWLWLGKFAHLWQPVPSIKSQNVAAAKVAAAAIPYACVALLAVIGFLRAAASRRWELVALLALLLIDAAVISFFITPARLRIPFDVVLLLAAGFALSPHAVAASAASRPGADSG